MLNILKKENLANVLIVVTRYFGGILLGTGGLVRAYSESLQEAISNSTIIEKCTGYIFKCVVAYNNFENFKCDINSSDILLLPGGNPEMFFSKVVQETEVLYEIKHYKGIIIGESAGACLQFKRYFITAKNNYYKYFAFYDGFGVLNDPFYIDVHSINNRFYMQSLSRISKKYQKKVYAIFNDGAILYNRKTNETELFGNVIKIKEE